MVCGVFTPNGGSSPVLAPADTTHRATRKEKGGSKVSLLSLSRLNAYTLFPLPQGEVRFPQGGGLGVLNRNCLRT